MIRKKENEEKKFMSPEDFENKTYTGTVTKATWEKSDTEWGIVEQLHLEIKPLDFTVKGNTGVMHEWYKYSKSKQSVWYKFLTSLVDCGVRLSDIDTLVGLTFVWSDYEFQYSNNDSEEIKTKIIRIPTERIMNPEPKQPADSETNKETHKIDPNIVKEKIPETPKTLTPQLIEKLYKMLETEVTKEELKDFGISNNINANELSEFMKTNIKDFKVVRINNKYKLNREHEKTI